ncbi:MAG: 30S ribosomal protein S20 [Oscillospiraceae bacterium]
MPNIKSAEKRVDVTKKQTLRNKIIKSNLKTILKKADAAIADNSADKEVIVKQAIKTIDKACAKGVLHKNCAARKKSSLTLKALKA